MKLRRRTTSRIGWLPPLNDAAVVALAWLASFAFRFSLFSNNAPANIVRIVAVSLPLAVVVWGGCLLAFGAYRTPWRHASLPDVRRLATASGVAALALAAALLVIRLPNFPRSIVFIHPLLAGASHQHDGACEYFKLNTSESIMRWPWSRRAWGRVILIPERCLFPAVRLGSSQKRIAKCVQRMSSFPALPWAHPRTPPVCLHFSFHCRIFQICIPGRCAGPNPGVQPPA
uniref:Uncharacterized protein n=1 Tax=mine drainage metagenome TaxID=410659 RepID=E6PNW2_9ZZZZ